MEDLDFSDCIITREMSEKRLLEIEGRLALRFGLTEDIRNKLIELDLKNELIEDELVADWHEAYSCWRDFVEHPDDSHGE